MKTISRLLLAVALLPLLSLAISCTSKGIKVDENLYISKVQYTALELWKELMPTFE